MKDEIILLTPPGAAAIAVVRVCGEGVPGFLQAVFSRDVSALRTVHGELRDNDTLIDDPVIVLSEDATFADINLHGGPWVVEATLRLAERHGFTRIMPALPLNAHGVDGSSELEREMLQHLPLATTELAIRTLLAQSAEWTNVKANPDQYSSDWFRERASDTSLTRLLNPPTVVIVGVPNAGKSTLANRIFATQRSIVADLPGTTRDWVESSAMAHGLPIRLIDTPGLRDTTDAIEAHAIALSRERIETADYTIALFDVTQPFEPEQRALKEHFSNVHCVANKCDLDGVWKPDPEEFDRISAESGDGVDALLAKIFTHFTSASPTEFVIDRPRCWTDRQRSILHEALVDRQRVRSL